MRIAGIVILSLLAFFTGGCSLSFTFDDYFGFNVLAGFGFIVCALSIWGIVALSRSAPASVDDADDNEPGNPDN